MPLEALCGWAAAGPPPGWPAPRRRALRRPGPCGPGGRWGGCRARPWQRLTPTVATRMTRYGSCSGSRAAHKSTSTAMSIVRPLGSDGSSSAVQPLQLVPGKLLWVEYLQQCQAAGAQWQHRIRPCARACGALPPASRTPSLPRRPHVPLAALLQASLAHRTRGALLFRPWLRPPLPAGGARVLPLLANLEQRPKPPVNRPQPPLLSLGGAAEPNLKSKNF